MNGDLQSRISPFTSPNKANFSDAKVKVEEKSIDGGVTAEKTSFKDLIMNSNDDVFYSREAQKNGDDLSGAKTDAEFAKVLSEKFNKENSRKPQNELDKESFMKLFVTQLQNQDPLNPDDSAQMAAQLAQFHGLEQMMNVNKNLEKMQASDSTSRAVGLINFVGKDIKLESGKVRLEDGAISAAMFRLDGESVTTKLEVRDAAGVVVHSRDLGLKAPGEHLIEWNGKDNEGKKAKSGAYTIGVTAQDISGNDIPAKMTTTVKVTGVDLQDSGGSFYTDMGKVRISEISSVGELGAVGGRVSKAMGQDQKGANGGAGSNQSNAVPTDDPAAAGQQQNGNQPKQGEPIVPPAQEAAAGVTATAPDAAAIAAKRSESANQELSPRSLVNSPGMPPMMEIPVPASLSGAKPES